MVFRSISFAAIRWLQRCLATASTVGRRQRGVPHGNSSGRPCAVCLSGDLSGSSKLIAVGALFPPIGLPAFDKSGCEILRSCGDPTIDDGRRKKSTSLDFASVDYRITATLSSIKPNKLLLGAC